MRSILRWTARLASVAVAVVFVVLWFRNPPHIAALPVMVRWQLVALVTGVAGLQLGLWRERLGGALAVAGFAAFLALEGRHLHTIPVSPAVFAMALPALLYLVVGARRTDTPAAPEPA